MCSQMDKWRTNVKSHSGQAVSGVDIMTAGGNYKIKPHSQAIKYCCQESIRMTAYTCLTSRKFVHGKKVGLKV